jgi:hypothetical protein
MMKKLLIIMLLTSALTTVSAQILFTYNFANDTVNLPLNGHNGWSNMSKDSFPGIGGTIGISEASVKRDTLAYPGFYTSLKGLDLAKADGVGHFITSNNTLPNGFAPTYASGDKIYVAFLYKPSTVVSDSGINSSGQIFRVYGKDSFAADGVAMRFIVQKSGAKARFGIDKNGGTNWTNFNYDLNKTHLIVMRYVYTGFLKTGNDTASLFVNPIATAAEPTTPAAISTLGSDYHINRFVAYLNNPSIAANTSFGTLGAIKIGRNWSDLFTTSAITDIKKKVNLAIHPSLATNEINLELAEGDPSVSSIKIADLSGRIVLTDKISAGQSSKKLTVNGLAKGLYIVSIQNDSFIATQKFIKE